MPLPSLSGRTVGVALAVAAHAVGFALYGWRGLVLAFTVTVFWLLLMASRALRALRAAATNPVGTCPNAVMLNAQLQPGLRLLDVLPKTRALGERRPAEAGFDEAFRWTDGHGDAVVANLRAGRLVTWTLERAARADDAGGAPATAGADDAPRLAPPA